MVVRMVTHMNTSALTAIFIRDSLLGILKKIADKLQINRPMTIYKQGL